jgi:hypothetical protein
MNEQVSLRYVSDNAQHQVCSLSYRASLLHWLSHDVPEYVEFVHYKASEVRDRIKVKP